MAAEGSVEQCQVELRKPSVFAQRLLRCQGQMFLAAFFFFFFFGLVVSGVTRAEEKQALQEKSGYQRLVQIPAKSQIGIDKRYLQCQRKSDQHKKCEIGQHNQL